MKRIARLFAQLSFVAVLAIAAMLALCLMACTSLENKTVLVQAGGTGLKATSAADSSTGTATPTIWMGLFDFLFLDHPKEAPQIVYYKSQAATLNSSAVTTTFVWIKDGTTANVSVKPDETLSLPGLRVVAGGSTVNISAISNATPSGSTQADSSSQTSK